MKAELYWIPDTREGRLAVMPRPRAGDWLEDEVQAWRVARIDIVVSLLTLTEVIELGLDDEAELCQRKQIEFISFPIADRQVPLSANRTIALAWRISSALAQDKGVAIHCSLCSCKPGTRRHSGF